MTVPRRYIHGKNPIPHLQRAFSKNLKELMSNLNITQSELSRRTGINTASISMYVNEKGMPTEENLHRLAKVLNCHPTRLTYVSCGVLEKHDHYYDLDGTVHYAFED